MKDPSSACGSCQKSKNFCPSKSGRALSGHIISSSLHLFKMNTQAPYMDWYPNAKSLVHRGIFTPQEALRSAKIYAKQSLDMVNELIRENWDQKELYKDSFELAQKRFFSILELEAKNHQFP